MCDEKYTEMISRYIDGDLDVSESAELEDHLNECSECRKTYQDLKKIRDLLNETEKSTLDDKWYNDAAKKIRKVWLKKINYKKIASYAAIVAGFMILTSAVYTNYFSKLNIPNPSSSYDQSIAPDNTVRETTKDSSGLSAPSNTNSSNNTVTADSNVFDPAKIIYSGTVNLYTDNYTDTSAKISEYVKSIGGFVENSSIAVNTDKRYDYSNYGYLQIRVPGAQFEQAMNTIQTYGEVKSVNTNSTNITQSYRNIQSELESYRIQESRLNEYLSRADKVADMLSIESELNRVRTEINYRASMLENYDVSMAYSTITITLYEKDLSTSSVSSPFKNIFLNIKKALIGSVNLILQIVSLIIIWLFRLLPFAVIGVGIYLIVKKIKSLKKNP